MEKIRNARNKTKIHQNRNIDSFFRKTFIDSVTDKALVEGQTYTRPTFAKTLAEIAENGPEIFYKGTLGQSLVKDLQKMGGIVTMEDLMKYRLPQNFQLYFTSTLYLHVQNNCSNKFSQYMGRNCEEGGGAPF